MRLRVPALALAVSAVLGTVVCAQDIQLERDLTRWRLSVEQLDNQGDDIGVLGVHYDALGIASVYPPLYAGIGGYVGVSGGTDGFLVGGFSLGSIWSPAPLWSIDMGVFGGAGGSPSRSVRDGWVVRPALAIERMFGLYGLRAEAAWWDGDDYDSDFSIAVGLTLSSEFLTGRDVRPLPHIPADQVEHPELRVTPRWMWMDPDSDAERRDGSKLDEDLSLVGLGVDYFLTDHVFLLGDIYGGTGGSVDGFIIAGAGLGFSVPIVGDVVRFEARASGIAGGGGGVETDSEIGWRALGGLRANVTDSIGIELMGGTTEFPSADFHAPTAMVGLSWTTRPVEFGLDYPRGNLEREGLSGEDTRLQELRFGPLAKFYSPPGDAHKKNGDEYQDLIKLAGFGVERPVFDFLTLTARAFAAYADDMGGYKEGLLGARIEWVPLEFREVRLGLHFEGGPAGGGGADLESGLIGVFSGGVGIPITDRVLFHLDWGKMEASQGSWEAEAVTTGITWRVQRPVRR